MLADDFCWLITSDQHGQLFVQNFNRLVSRPNVMPWQILYFSTNWIPINLVFHETFLLTHTFGTACAIEMAIDREGWSELPMGATTVNPFYVRNISHQEVRCSTTCMARADNKLCTTIHSREVTGCNTLTIRGGTTQPLLMKAIQIHHKEERGTHILSLHGCR